MAIVFRCPGCDTKLRVPHELAGRKTKCPRCGIISIVPDEDGTRADAASQEADDGPKRPRLTKKATNRGLVIGLVLGGLALLILTGSGVTVCLIAWSFNSPMGSLFDDRNLTEENIKKIQLNMSLEEVQEILGKGRKATEADLRQANAKGRGFGPFAVQFRPGTTKYVWRSKNAWFFVDIDDNSKKVVGTNAVSGS